MTRTEAKEMRPNIENMAIDKCKVAIEALEQEPTQSQHIENNGDMTLDEAILHAEEVADRCAVTDGNINCETEHRQLAEWLKDYKRLKEQSNAKDSSQHIECVENKSDALDSALEIEDCISRKDFKVFLSNVCYNDESPWGKAQKAYIDCFGTLIDRMPSVQPKHGGWEKISMDKYTQHAQYYYRCSECGEEVIGEHNYCSNCGSRMDKQI